MHFKRCIMLMMAAAVFTACTPNQRPNVRRDTTNQGQNQGQDQGQGPLQGQGNTSSIQQKTPSMQIQGLTTKIPILSGTDGNAKIIGYLNAGQKMQATDRVGGKYAVATPQGKTGYVDCNKTQPAAQNGNAAQPLAGAPASITRSPAGTPTTTNTPATGAAAPAGNRTGTTTGNAPADTAAAGQLTGNEQQMLSLVNQERTKNGLKALQIDTQVEKLSRMKAQDMIDKRYFSHQSPTYGSPFDMLKSNGVNYLYAGENIAGNPTVSNAHTSLMNSPGHRKNILSPNFTHVGIGIKDGGQYGKTYVQMFIGR